MTFDSYLYVAAVYAWLLTLVTFGSSETLGAKALIATSCVGTHLSLVARIRLALVHISLADVQLPVVAVLVKPLARVSDVEGFSSEVRAGDTAFVRLPLDGSEALEPVAVG